MNILYAVPLPPSQISRLASLAKQLRPDSITLMIDHASQLVPLQTFHNITGFPAGAFLKVDTGYHRAGLPPHALNKDGLLQKLAQLHSDGLVNFVGLYSHSSLSYNNSTSAQAIETLIAEVEGCIEAVKINRNMFPETRPLILSVGASPQVTSIQNALNTNTSSTQRLRKLISTLSPSNPDVPQITLELHAGVYSIMDMQQLSTKAVDSLGNPSEEIALSVLAEVISVYNDGERAKPEALVAAGTLALGREPCHSYAGWGVLAAEAPGGDQTGGRLVVERISQEHAILSWDGGAEDSARDRKIDLDVGESVRISPNHACVTGAMYDRYFVVDSGDESKGCTVVDVWERCRGW